MNHEYITSFLLVAILLGLIISSTATIATSASIQLPPRRPIPPAPGGGGDPPSIKKIVLPETLNRTLVIDGEDGWVEITGSTTMNFSTSAPYGIRIYNAEKVIIKNVHIRVASFENYIRVLYIGGGHVVGDKLIIDFNGRAKTRWGYIGFYGIYAYRVSSFKMNTIQVNFHLKIESSHQFWHNTNYNETNIFGYGTYIYLRPNSHQPARYSIGTIMLTYNPRTVNENTIISYGWVIAARIRAWAAYSSQNNGLPIYGEGTIGTVALKGSSVAVYFDHHLETLRTSRVSARINNLVMNNIRITKRIIEGSEGHKWSYGFVGGIEMYRSKVYVDRIIGTNVVMGTNYGEAYLISGIYRSVFTHKYILTRSFGIGKGNITGGVVPTWFMGFGGLGFSGLSAGLLNGNRYDTGVVIQHAFLRDTPANIGSSGMKTLRGFLSISTKMSGYVGLYSFSDEKRAKQVYIGPVKNSRITIAFNQRYTYPNYNALILYTGNVITLMIVGNDIKITINGKTYAVDMIILSSSDARIRGMLFMNRYDGSSARIVTRSGAINGIYPGQTYIGGGD